METKKIVCPFSKTEVELKAWITIGESKAIERPFKSLKMTVDSSGIGKGEMDAGTATDETIRIAVETVVVSVAGKTDKIYDTVMAMRKNDGQFVLDEVDKIVKGEDFLSEGGKPAAGIASAN